MNTLKDEFTSKIPKKLVNLIPAGYDLIGDIVILEVPSELVKYEKKMAEFILKTRPNVKVVLKKAGVHTGIFRRQKLRCIAGDRRKETVYRENGVMLKLNVETVYFSPRLSNERKRIASLVQPGESVLVMFSGCAPYPLVISKNSKPKEVYGIEINPAAHKYALENVQLNKASNVKLFKGDVRKVAPLLKKKFDRIVMPLPKTADDFLGITIPLLKKRGVLHFYDFQSESLLKESEQKVIDSFSKRKRKCSVIQTVLCGQHAPRVFRICVDVQAN